MVKLIVTDMDGTLLNNKNDISPDFWKIHESLKKKGIIFSVASGRQYYSMKDKLEAIKNDTIFIAENGAYIVYQDKEIYCNPLNQKDVNFLINIIKNINGIRIVLYGRKSAYTDVTDEKFLQESNKFFKNLEIINNFEKIKDEIFKISVNHPQGAEENIYPFLDEYKNKYKIVIGEKKWLDIMKIDTDKGIALQKLQKELNISKDETMAFGDYLNDCGLLENAKYSFAMENAHPELKKIANYMTDTNDNNGFVNAVKNYLDDKY